MKAVLRFAEHERDSLKAELLALNVNPYRHYDAFRSAVSGLINRGAVPASMVDACRLVRKQREQQETYAHLLCNCPIDDDVPVYDQQDPVVDKYKKKKTYVGEGVLELFSQLTRTPLLAYTTRNNGDFFHDVYADNRYSGTQTQKSDGELFFHNDRTAHPVRADYLALLGMRCPTNDLVYTCYVDGRGLTELLSEESQALLRETAYVTPFDEYSRDSNDSQDVSEPHAVLENAHSFRYYDTRTRPANTASPSHYAALMDLRDALARATREYHRMQHGDLLVIANQDGLHSRVMIDIREPERTRLRWLLKTYAFQDDHTADSHAGKWASGVRGRVLD